MASRDRGLSPPKMSLPPCLAESLPTPPNERMAPPWWQWSCVSPWPAWLCRTLHAYWAGCCEERGGRSTGGNVTDACCSESQQHSKQKGFADGGVLRGEFQKWLFDFVQHYSCLWERQFTECPPCIWILSPGWTLSVRRPGISHHVCTY